MIDKLTNLVKNSGGAVDKLSTSDHEISQELTRRQEIDMTSSFKLPHIVRPVSFLIVIGLQVVLAILTIILSFVYLEDPTMVVLGVSAENSVLLGTMAGFYFKSRRDEKIQFRNARANEKLKEMELEHKIKQEEIKTKSEIRKDRRADRKASRK